MVSVWVEWICGLAETLVRLRALLVIMGILMILFAVGKDYPSCVVTWGVKSLASCSLHWSLAVESGIAAPKKRNHQENVIAIEVWGKICYQIPFLHGPNRRNRICRCNGNHNQRLRGALWPQHWFSLHRDSEHWSLCQLGIYRRIHLRDFKLHRKKQSPQKTDIPKIGNQRKRGRTPLSGS